MIATATTPQIKYTPRGAARALWHQAQRAKPPREILIEGPAGTGKTRALCEWTNDLCTKYPGIRVLWARFTLTSMRQSVQVTFEEKVLPPKAKLLRKGGSRKTRTSYDYPNGSEIVLGGLQPSEITRTFSTEYDVIIVFEAVEISLDTWELMARANRNWVLPWQQRIADTNPGSEFHWLNQHFPEGRRGIEGVSELGDRLRLFSRHEDNPAVSDDYLESLRALTGHRRARMYEGRWVSEEGQVWPQYDPGRHLIDYIVDPEVRDGFIRDKHGQLDFTWFGVGIDWGFRNPGSMVVGGFDSDGRCVIVEEIYQPEKEKDWWADRFVELVNRWGVRRAWADSAEPGTIQAFNTRLREEGLNNFDPKGDIEKATGVLVFEAKKAVQAGLDLVRDALTVDNKGLARLYFARERLHTGACQELKKRGKPTCVTEEIPSYVYPKSEEGKEIKEAPDASCDDHGCDALRYLSMGAWTKDLTVSEPQQWAPGTFGDAFAHLHKPGVKRKRSSRAFRRAG